MAIKVHPIVRVSSRQQLDGHGLESQLQALSSWIEAKINAGLDYEQGEPLELEGVSAYTKSHIPSINEFVDALPEDSIILFTEPSRLTRMNFEDSFNFLWSILRRKVSVAFLNLDTVIKHSDEEQSSVYTKLAIFFELARSESQVKSNRINNHLNNRDKQLREGIKRKLINIPYWLNSSLEVTEYNEETIKLIFKLRLEGLGTVSIAKALVYEHDRKPFNNSRWTAHYINNLLKNRAVLGEFQPTRGQSNKGSKKEKSGEPISLFPQIITEDTFYRVQHSFDTQPRGNKSTVPNPYRGLLRCHKCGHSQSMASMVQRGKRYTYYKCQGKKSLATDCYAKALRYELVDERIQLFLPFFDVGLIEKLRPRREALDAQIKELTSEITNLVDTISSIGSIPELVTKLGAKQAKRDELQSELTKPSTVPNRYNNIDRNKEPDTYSNALRSVFKSIQIDENTCRYNFKLVDYHIEVDHSKPLEEVKEQIENEFAYLHSQSLSDEDLQVEILDL